MDRIGFVILHYIDFNETIACVNNIMNLIDTDEYQIVIVDNGSPNNSGELVRKHFEDYDRIHTIICNSNLGFSRGNNIGFRYAKRELECNYIIVLNNDVFIRSKDFYGQIKTDYIDYNAAVIGPRVYTKTDDQGTQNPQWKAPSNDKERITDFKSKLIDLYVSEILSYIFLDRIFLLTKHKIGLILKKKNRIAKEYYEEKHVNVQLHGCILCFTPIYTTRYDGLEEISFMYHEETLLYRRMMNDSMITLYDPTLEVIHDGKIATMKVSKSKTKSLRVRYRRERDSIRAILTYLQTGQVM